MSINHMTIWVGYDGSYVFSKTKLKKVLDKQNGNHFLSPTKGARCIDVHDAPVAFPQLKQLKMWEVVKMTVWVMK